MKPRIPVLTLWLLVGLLVGGVALYSTARTDKNELQAGQFSTIVLEYTVGAALPYSRLA